MSQFKTVGGYEVFEDGESGDSVKIHQLQACLKYDSHNVFNSKYMHVHHRNTIGWDNRLHNLLLFRARYHKTFHDREDWEELVKHYGETDVSKQDLRSIESYYETITQNYVSDE